MRSPHVENNIYNVIIKVTDTGLRHNHNLLIEIPHEENVGIMIEVQNMMINMVMFFLQTLEEFPPQPLYPSP